MKTILKFGAALGLAVGCLPASAALNVFACEPEWGALAQEIGGDRVSVYSATTALQDPHRIEARPSLIARIRSADLLICSGSELEIGWLPLLLTQSGNSRIQLGTPGYIEASQYVAKLEIPRVIDRALGDIHPGGNPHVHTDPRNIAKVASVLEERLAQVDPGNAETYHSRAKAFLTRWQAAIGRWEKEAAPLRGVPIVEHHKAFSYFINWTGMREVGTLEPKPGIPPTPSHLAELVDLMKAQPAKVIVYSSYDSPQAAQFLSERSKIPAVMLPFTVGGTDKAKDLFGFFDDLIGRLLGVVK
ncbi:MAG TPA: zinc ABC transporter substrate-binding protein [Burkholderiales bacterium]|nr:zinc ABC transporter substrate-binding protein [Burkholderiales bacterium]HYA46159.1 zinc ABC transporter substrate-binding protein [Burkholderiales bacterium]